MEISVRKKVEKMKKTFNVETLAEENFSVSSPEENPTYAEGRRKRRKRTS